MTGNLVRTLIIIGDILLFLVGEPDKKKQNVPKET